MELKKNFFNGFTLIELLITISIIGILLALAVPSYNKQILKNRFEEAKVMLNSLIVAQENYRLEHGKYFTVTTGAISNESIIANNLNVDFSISPNFAYQILSNGDMSSYKLKGILLPDFWMNNCASNPLDENYKCKIDSNSSSDWLDQYTRGTTGHYIEVRYPTALPDAINWIDYTHMYEGAY